jgi:CHAT domain-containing protein
VFLVLTCGLGCARRTNPQFAFEHAYKTFLHGDPKRSQDEAHEGCQRFRDVNPEWSWKFRILEAKSLLLRGMSRESLALLKSGSPPPSATDSAIEILVIQGIAYGRLHTFVAADQSLQQAEQLCSATSYSICGELIRAQGVVAIEHGQLKMARGFFFSSLSFARSHRDQFLEASALLNLGVSALNEEHFDEAVRWTEAALESATAIDAGAIAAKALGNLGWAYYNLGDWERSLRLSEQAEKRAVELGNVIDELSYLNNLGYVYADRHDFPRAKQSYADANALAVQIGSKQHIYNTLRALALASVESDDLETARKASDEAIAVAQADKNRLNELYPLLVRGMIAARSQAEAEAERIFREVEGDPASSASLRWRAEHSLARLFDEENRLDDADREYKAALATFEGARSSLHRKDAVLPFSTNAFLIYDDYIHFLVARGKTDEALRWAEHSRARSLAEGLRLLPNGAAGPPPLNAQGLAERMKGALLFYWLGEKQSYLWAITPRKVTLFHLPAAAEIGAAVERYRLALTGPQDVLESANLDGSFLYHTLVAPVHDLLPKDGRVFIIPDGPLNNLNFETLPVPEPTPHYWIQDVTVSNASSLRMLAASRRGEKKQLHNLLLIGNSVPPSEKYPALPRAGAQMESVAKHFSLGRQKILAGEQATPAAYLGSNPEQYSFIHFVAHGTASRLSPLDSAIVLSKTRGADDSFKLYARDIMQHPLNADLVTISACYGSGERSYAGEGLVGLSWAFLGSGAHNVIAALWEATDTSTEQLMGTFYDELDKGASLDAALRTAKLSLLQGRFHNPFYWAPFQLYTGS